MANRMVKGVINFNDSKLAGQLISLFDRIETAALAMA